MSQLIGRGIKGVCQTPVGEDSRKPAPGFLWTLPYAHVPFANFASYTLTIINHSHKQDYMLSAVNYPSASQNLKVVLKIPNMI